MKRLTLNGFPHLSLLLFLLVGCGASVDRLSLSDPRLPVDARRWVADAEDAVVVASARLADANKRLAAARDWNQRITQAKPYTGAVGGKAQLQRSQMANAIISERTVALELARGDLELANARRKLIYAETAMRHDISVYNMTPLRAHVDEKLQTVLALRDRHRKSRRVALNATDAWWATWRKYVASKSDTGPFWTEAQ